MEKAYDIAVIGGGAAGYTAALYAARYGFETAVFEKQAPGGQLLLTANIENYPGFKETVSGFDLALQMKAGAERAGAVSESSAITKVSLSEPVKRLFTSGGEIHARAVIICTGARPRSLGLKEEKKLIGHGVSYCAECDGNFYKNQAVAVVGGGNTAVQEALSLSRICEKVYLIHRKDTLKAMKSLTDSMEKAANITPVYGANVTRLLGETRLEGIEVTGKDGKTEAIPIKGLFVAIGRIPQTELLRGQLSLDGQGYLVATETTVTDIPGVFAAGDVRTKALRQIVTATADGANAAFHAEKYLTEQNTLL